MADIKKTIECLKELEAKATPGPWEVGSCKTTIYDKDGSYLGDFDRLPPDDIAGDAALIVAVRNALAELLAELERLEARAEKAEAERDWLLENLTELSEMCPYAEGFSLDSSCEECDGVDNVAKCWHKLLAKVGTRKAASTDN